MNTEELFNEINKKAIELNKQWKENKLSSRKIRKQVEFNIFCNRELDFVIKISNFYALDNRVKERYNSFIKTLLLYFSWKKETQLLSKIKRFIKCPNNFNIQSIITQKIENFVSGENCFDNDMNKKNGTQLKNNKHDKTLNKKIKQNTIENKDEKQIEINKLNKIAKEAQNAEMDRIKREIGVEGISFDAINKDKIIIDKTPNYNENFDNLQIENSRSDALFTTYNMSTRERIEIPQCELLNFEKQITQKDIQKFSNNDAKIVKNFALEQNKYIKQTADSFNHTKNCETTKTDNERIDIGKKQEKNINYDNMYDKVQKANSNNMRNNQEKTNNDNLNNYNKKLTNAINSDNKGYEQQKREIAGEEIAKMSEKDLQSIKNYMQEELNKQMRIAEEKGEVYKMPLSIKEVIDSKPSEKSEVQTNISHKPVLKSNK